MNSVWIMEIIRAYDNGEQIQRRRLDDESSGWEDVADPKWNFAEFDYRVRPTRMSYRQLAEWYARGFGEIRKNDGGTRNVYRVGYLDYWPSEEEHIVSDSYEIRYWQTDEWLKPTAEIYARDCLKKETR